MIIGLIIIFAVGALLLAVIGGQKTPRGRKKAPTRQHFDRELVRSRWQTVEQMAHTGGSGLRNAVSEADKLLDYTLRGRGYSGQTMAERLKKSESRLSDKEAVWEAHKLRNHLAHEVGFDLVASQAQAALAAFRQALSDLGAL